MIVYEKESQSAPITENSNQIRRYQGPNDYASMHEVLTRRFTHGIQEQTAEEKIATGSGCRTFPDIMMDGGRGQVNICLAGA